MPAIINNFNWLDVFYLILLIGMGYKGSKTGVGGQMIGLAGYSGMVFVSIGYYDLLSKAIFGFLLQSWAKPISFFAIILGIFFIIKMLERIFGLVNEEELSTIEKIGGLVVSAVRASILYGLIGILVLLVPLDNAETVVMKDSRTCGTFVRMDAGLFGWLYGILEKDPDTGTDEIIEKIVRSGRE